MYEKFQEWLNDCPVQIEDYQDNVDHIVIRFDIASNVNEEEQSYVDSLLTSGTDYPPLTNTEYTHDSEGC